MSSFYELILKKQQEGSGERQLFCRLCDGNTEWTLTSATGSGVGEKREVLIESSLALGGFTQPEPFIQLFKPLARMKDGFLDRILICSIKPHLLHEQKVEEWCEKLGEYSIQGFADIYEKVFDLHQDGFEYTFSDDGKRYYIEYSNKLSDTMNKQWDEKCICTDNLSKDKKNFIRLSCVLHVLINVQKHLEENPDEEQWSIDDKISVETLRIADELIEFFSKQRKAFLMVLDPIEGNIKEKRQCSNLKSNQTTSDSEEKEDIPAEEILTSFAEWFIRKHENLPKQEIEKFSGQKTTKVGGRKETLWAFRYEDCTQQPPFSKDELELAATATGGKKNDGGQFYSEELNKKIKRKCFLVQVDAIRKSVRKKLLNVLGGIKIADEPEDNDSDKDGSSITRRELTETKTVDNNEEQNFETGEEIASLTTTVHIDSEDSTASTEMKSNLSESENESTNVNPFEFTEISKGFQSSTTNVKKSSYRSTTKRKAHQAKDDHLYDSLHPGNVEGKRNRKPRLK